MTKKIMVVDDDPSIIISIEQGLKLINEEYNVIGAKSGEECFALLENNQIPDLILLDIGMPGMNGWQVMNRLNQNRTWNKIPVVFLTAKTDTFSKTFGRSLARDYITKPFETRELERRIDNILCKINNDETVLNQKSI